MNKDVLIFIIVLIFSSFVFTAILIHEYKVVQEKIKEPQLECESESNLYFADYDPDTKNVSYTKTNIVICNLKHDYLQYLQIQFFPRNARN